MITCAVLATCGRPEGHRGHHGGYRPLRTAVHAPGHYSRPGMPPTETQLLVLAETIEHGDQGEAAECLNVTLQTLRNNLHSLRIRIGATTPAHAALLLGWCVIPSSIDRHPPAPPESDS